MKSHAEEEIGLRCIGKPLSSRVVLTRPSAGLQGKE